MARKTMQTLTESMFYILMALSNGEKCGIDIAEHIEKRTDGRIKIGPATIYTVLAKFEKERVIVLSSQEGYKKVYKITQKGRDAYAAERERIWACLFDAEEEEKFETHKHLYNRKKGAQKQATEW